MNVQPWHKLCTLRADVRTGRLTLDEFAADLNGVRTGEAPPVYHEAPMIFSRTYSTFRMKQLVRDVLLRLAGQGGKPVQQHPGGQVVKVECAAPAEVVALTRSRCGGAVGRRGRSGRGAGWRRAGVDC